MIITVDTYNKLLNSYVNPPPEFGVILGKNNDIVCKTFFDYSGETDCNRYIANVNLFNTIISEWLKKNIIFCGIAHSHPNHQHYLSTDDINYIKKIMYCIPSSINELYFPIIISSRLISHKALRVNNDVKIVKDKLIII